MCSAAALRFLSRCVRTDEAGGGSGGPDVLALIRRAQVHLRLERGVGDGGGGLDGVGWTGRACKLVRAEKSEGNAACQLAGVHAASRARRGARRAGKIFCGRCAASKRPNRRTTAQAVVA